MKRLSIVWAAVAICALWGCGDELTGGSSAPQEGFCQGTAAGACASDADCMVGTRCVDATFCAVTCTSDDQCGDSSCFFSGDSPSEPEVAMPEMTMEPEVDPDNNAPTAADDSYELAAGEGGELEVLDNDMDPDGDEIDITGVTQPEHGTVVAKKGRVEYTSTDTEFVGTDTFEYTIEDGRGGTDTATVTLNIVDPPPPPTITITSPGDGAAFEGGTFELAFEATCQVSSPSQNPDECHVHKILNGENWTDAEGRELGHYTPDPIMTFPLEPGEYEITLRLHLNDGTDGPFDPEISDTITITILPDAVPVAEVAGTINTAQMSEDGASLLLGTSNGVSALATETHTLSSVYEGGSLSTLAQDPFDTDRYYGSGAGNGFDDWGFIESRDNGASWSEVSLSGETTLTRLASSPDRAGVLAGISAQTLFTSENTGRTRNQDDWPTEIKGIEILSDLGPVVLVGGPGGIEQVTFPDVASEVLVEGDVTSLDRTPDGFIYGTADNGLNLCSSDLTNCMSINGPEETASKVIVDAEDASKMYVLTTSGNIFKTGNAGEVWILSAISQ